MIPEYWKSLKIFNSNRWGEAVLSFKKVLQIGGVEEKIGACFYTSICYANLGYDEWRKEILIDSFNFDLPRPEICCQLADYYFRNKDNDKAIYWYSQAVQREKTQNYEFFIKDYWGYIPNIQLCVCFDRLGQIEKANSYNEKAAAYKPDSEAVIGNREYFNSILEAKDLDFIAVQKKNILSAREEMDFSQLSNKGVSLIVPTNKAKYLDSIFENFERQNYSVKELIIILNKNTLDYNGCLSRAKKYENIKVYQLDESKTLGECLNLGISKAKYDIIGKMDDDDYYGENYITDQVLGLEKADVVCKSKRFILFEKDQTLWTFRGYGENCKTYGGAGGTIMATRKVFDKVKFEHINVAEDEAFFQECSRQGFFIYSTNKFNYLYKRHALQSEHTFVDANQFYKKSAVLVSTKAEEFLDIISV